MKRKAVRPWNEEAGEFTRDYMKRLTEQYPDASVRQLAAVAGLAHATIWRWMKACGYESICSWRMFKP